MVKKVYLVENLDCANCASKVEAALNALPEVQEAVLTYATMQLRITAEDPDALLPNLGGQTALNLAISLQDAGILDKYHVKVIGVDLNAIKRGEDRIEFKKTMDMLGVPMAKSEPSYSVEEAEKIAEEKGFIFVEDAGRGYRRVVPSPIPKRIVELNVVDQLVRAGDIVITVGGGGIPVVETEDGLRGVAAVIDKDRASSLLAQDVRADRLIILTAVDAVCVNYNKPDQKELSSMTIAECEKYIAEGQFAPGSMLPKVESCMEFVKNNDHGGTALITSLARAADALEGKTGTVITR